MPRFPVDPEKGITGIDTSINLAIKELREKKIGGIYLPNTRWFHGEEDKGEARDHFTLQLAGLADIFVNDAFGSWQPHASTYDITSHLPSYAGFLMQQEIVNLGKVLEPERPFVAVVAGSKYDTKIKPLYAIYEKVDKLILGGVIYNTYLCAKYGVKISGVEDGDIALARELVEKDRGLNKIVELPHVVESDVQDACVEGKYRTLSISEFRGGSSYGYLLDIDPSSFDDQTVSRAIQGARTIFVNAVMGFTPHFTAGSQALDHTIDLTEDVRRRRYPSGIQESLSRVVPVSNGQREILLFYRRRHRSYRHRAGYAVWIKTGTGTHQFTEALRTRSHYLQICKLIYRKRFSKGGDTLETISSSVLHAHDILVIHCPRHPGLRWESRGKTDRKR